MSEPVSAGVAGYGMAKAATAAASAAATSTTATFVGGGIGAAIVMCLRLPKSRIEMFLQVVVAFGFSIPLAPVVARYFEIRREHYTTMEYDMALGFIAAIVASMSWGILSIILNMRDRAVKDPEAQSAGFLEALRALRDSGSLAEKKRTTAPVERDMGDLSIQPPVFKGTGNEGKYDQ